VAVPVSVAVPALGHVLQAAAVPVVALRARVRPAAQQAAEAAAVLAARTSRSHAPTTLRRPLSSR